MTPALFLLVAALSNGAALPDFAVVMRDGSIHVRRAVRRTPVAPALARYANV